MTAQAETLSDKTMKFKVYVTRKDIRNGRKDELFNSPILGAVKRAYKRVSGKTLMDLVLVLDYKATNLPKRVQRFCRLWDNNKPVKPISFWFEW